MPNANVISFNEAVLQLQRLNKTAANQEKFAKEDAMTQKIMVGLDAQGNKEIQRQEEIEDKQEKHQSKMEESLIEIRDIMSDISKTISIAIASGISGNSNAGSALAKGTELTENESEAAKAQADADKEQHVLLNKLIEGISGLKKATDEGLTKLGATFKEGSAGGGGILGGLSSLLGAGKDLVGGGIKGMGGKLAGAARGGLGMISRAGPLAGIAGLGLAGFNVVNDVMGNIDQSNAIEENVKSGALSRKEGNVLQGESLGSTAGTAAGAAIGGIAGSALGPLGTAAGMWLGSKVGGFAGGVAGKYGVKAYQGIKGLFGFGETKEQEKAKMSPEQQLMQDYASGNINAEEYNKKMKLQTEGGAATPESLSTSASATKEETYYDSNGVKLKKKSSVSGKDLMSPVNSEVPPDIQAAVSANESLSTGEQIVPASNIVATPTQQAKTGGMWDSIKSMGASAWGGIKSGANWLGDKASAVGSKVGSALSEGYDNVKDFLGFGPKVDTNDPKFKEYSDLMAKHKMLSSEMGDGKNASDSFKSEVAGLKSRADELAGPNAKAWARAAGKPVGATKSNAELMDDSKWGADATPTSVSPITSSTPITSSAPIGSKMSSGNMTVEELAMAEAKKYGRTTPNIDDKRAAQLMFKGQQASTGDQVYGASSETANARDDLASKNAGGTAVVNAPTTVNNTTQQASIMKSPFRNEEGSLNRYYNTRMGVY